MTPYVRLAYPHLENQTTLILLLGAWIDSLELWVSYGYWQYEGATDPSLQNESSSANDGNPYSRNNTFKKQQERLISAESCHASTGSTSSGYLASLCCAVQLADNMQGSYKADETQAHHHNHSWSDLEAGSIISVKPQHIASSTRCRRRAYSSPSQTSSTCSSRASTRGARFPHGGASASPRDGLWCLTHGSLGHGVRKLGFFGSAGLAVSSNCGPETGFCQMLRTGLEEWVQTWSWSHFKVKYTITTQEPFQSTHKHSKQLIHRKMSLFTNENPNLNQSIKLAKWKPNILHKNSKIRTCPPFRRRLNPHHPRRFEKKNSDIQLG